jgi:hypothetical protein
MTSSPDFNPYLPERQPHPEDYKQYARIEVVHMAIDPPTPGNSREEQIRQRLRELREAGITIEEVEIDTNRGDLKGINVAIAGGLDDVCAAKRRGFVREHGGKAKVDLSLTTSY